jgi:hypothetical protein
MTPIENSTSETVEYSSHKDSEKTKEVVTSQVDHETDSLASLVSGDYRSTST